MAPSTFDDPSAITNSESCAFCPIAQTYPPYDPRAPPAGTAQSISPDKLSPAAFVVLSTPVVLAFLDIMPLSQGHLLLCPRRHAPKVTDTTPAEAAELGRYTRILSQALVRATGVPDWNVVQNNGARAAQVVDHVHFHLIPRPARQTSRSFTMFGRGMREELDDEEAAVVAEKIRAAVRDIVSREAVDSKL